VILGTRARIARYLVAAFPLLLLVFLFSGCEALGGPMNTFSAEGEVAEKQANLLIITIIPAFVIFVGVMFACVFLVFRFRRKSEDEPLPKQIHGNTKLEIGWTIAPTVLLIAIAVPILFTIFDLGRDADEDALQVTVYGQQFNFDFAYPHAVLSDGDPLTVTDELHIPVDREVNATLIGRDVIHSFWVPKLAGKEDVVPGHQNELWFIAENPGTFQGQCAELCGVGHADMRFIVIAETQEEFDAWIAEQVAAENAEIAEREGQGSAEE
jgi:cytochrome c oxidase subunit 2